MNESLSGFNRHWKERAAHRRAKSDWATIDVVPQEEKKKRKEETDEEAISAGSIVKIALCERFKSVNVYITNIGNRGMRPISVWQRKLCKVLVGVCLPEGSTKITHLLLKRHQITFYT